MDNPTPPTTADPAVSPKPPTDLSEVLGALAERLGASAPVLPPPSDAHWTEQISNALRSIGFKGRIFEAHTKEGAALAIRELPVLTRADDGSFWLLDDRFAGYVRARRLTVLFEARWMRQRALEERIGAGTRHFLLPEPQLPASPLTEAGRVLSPVSRLLRLAAQERSDLALIALFTMTSGALSLASPIAIQILINWLAFGGLVQPVLWLGAALLCCLALAALLSLLGRITVEILERRLFVRIAADLAARLPRAKLAALDGVNREDLANRFFDVLTLQKAAGTLLVDGLGAALQVVASIVLLGAYHPWLLLFDLILVAGMLMVLVPLGRGALTSAIYESKSKYRVAGFVEEMVRRPAIFRLGGLSLADERSEDLVGHWLEDRDKHFRVHLRQMIGVQVLQVSAGTALLVLCGSLVLNGELTLGQLVAAEFIVAAALQGLVKFTDKLDTLYDLAAGVDKLGALMDLPLEQSEGVIERPAGGGARVEATGVAAQGLPPQTLLLSPSSRTAILGKLGQGRSALGEILAGIRPPSRGELIFDGSPADRYASEALFRDTMLLRPDQILLSSIRDNLALGLPLRDELLWEALAKTSLDAAVSALPDRLDQALGAQAHPLSPVQARRLLVARALLHRPRLLVVDGLLDDLTPEDRASMTPALLDADKPWTLLLVTGEPETAALCERTHTLGAAQ